MAEYKCVGRINKIIAGTNITISPASGEGDDITINAASGSGEANTASNVGVAGVGIYKQKTGVNLELKKINAGSSKVTVTDDTPNNEVDIDVSLVKADVGLGNVDNTSDANKPVSTAQQTALDAKQATSGKDASGGYAGLTLFKINFKDVLNTFISFFTNSNTAARTYTFQDRNGTIADDTDLALKAPLASPALTGTPGIAAATGQSLAVTGALSSSSPSAGIGYAAGAGGTVTQLTSKSTGVTLNKICGRITMNGAALASATIVTFTVTNSSVAANDVICIQHDSVGTIGGYTIMPNTPAAGSFKISIRNNTAGSLSEAIVLRFVIIKAVTA